MQRLKNLLMPGLLVGLLTGCQIWLTAPLPTVMPKAEFPEIPVVPVFTEEPMPATFTPDVLTAPAVAAFFTQVPTKTPTPTFTPYPTHTPTPSTTPIIHSGIFPIPVEAPYFATPPTSTDCNGQGTVLNSRFPSKVAGRTRPYHIYLPPCYGQDGRVYPVIYLIHGSIQTDSHWLELGLARYADEGIASGRYPPFIAIMPYSGLMGNVTSGGWKSIEGITVDYLLPYIDDNYCAWSEGAGRSIGGISRGGYWALEIAFSHPELFSAVSGHSSHLRFQTDPAEYNPLATYATADLSNMRIWLDRGEKDFLRPGQNQLHQSLDEAGIAHEYHINEGGHSDFYWAEHLPEYLDWHLALWPKDRESYPPCN
ncbi:MAG: hypothetical protein AMJ56_10390 [Anaerolineae bacterium SG8_19]|nr:MAG: hypothetical protein AMJ56_10390 [Anaerolineae bacterium SG8_19]